MKTIRTIDMPANTKKNKLAENPSKDELESKSPSMDMQNADAAAKASHVLTDCHVAFRRR